MRFPHEFIQPNKFQFSTINIRPGKSELLPQVTSAVRPITAHTPMFFLRHEGKGVKRDEWPSSPKKDNGWRISRCGLCGVFCCLGSFPGNWCFAWIHRFVCCVCLTSYNFWNFLWAWWARTPVHRIASHKLTSFELKNEWQKKKKIIKKKKRFFKHKIHFAAELSRNRTAFLSSSIKFHIFTFVSSNILQWVFSSVMHAKHMQVNNRVESTICTSNRRFGKISPFAACCGVSTQGNISALTCWYIFV